MKTRTLAYPVLSFLMGIMVFASCQNQPAQEAKNLTLKEAFNNKFYIGVALNTDQVSGIDSVANQIIKTQFISITAENCMKSESLQPEQGHFNFKDADDFVAFGEQNNMFIVGHCLVWHSQTPKWLFIDKDGNDVSRDTLIARMKSHIQTVVGRYKGRVNGWDVVNEAIDDNGGLRNTKYLQIIGPDYIEIAYQFAHEADPEAELYYNDYALNRPGKRDDAVKLVQNLLDKGLRVDAIGMQAHYGLIYDVFSDVEKSIQAFSTLGVKVMVTELDVTVLPNPDREVIADVSRKFELEEKYNPYKEALPDSVSNQLTEYYTHLFKIYNQYSENISRVTLWGLNDQQSWRNYHPIHGRSDYPLLFDRNNQPKPAFYSIIALTEKK